jgi:dTDP-4-amino-4,6-dideoxygalactose transaminase
MSLYIGPRPTFHFSQVFAKREKEGKIFPLNERGCFFFSARYALAAGIKALGIKPGDAVLLPSYNCGAEIDPILHSKVKPIFYKIGKNLLVDCDDLVNKINKDVKAILVTHFWGFPQPLEQIRKVCVERNLYLIEDCAHAFLSTHGGKYLGSDGDIGIFSLLKTLPIPNGGMLVINNMNIKYEHNTKKPDLFPALFYIISELLRKRTQNNKYPNREDILNFLYSGVYFSLYFVRLFLAGFRKYFYPRALYLVRPDSYLFIDGLRSWGISGLSKRILNNTDLEEIKSIRRRNFEYLLNYFHKNERGILPFKELPLGVCPLFFPIILESAEKREKLYKMLRDRGVASHPWWDRFHPEVPWKEFPDSVYLKQTVLGLPIHQDLTIKHLDRIIESFEDAYRRI